MGTNRCPAVAVSCFKIFQRSRSATAHWLELCHLVEEKQKVSLLNLSWNQLNGEIPQWIRNFKFLFYLALPNNSFSGNIPKSLTRLPGFIDHNVSSLWPCTSIPTLMGNENGRYLQYNQCWNLPLTLDLSYNKLSAKIWPSFRKLKSLQVLHLDNNNLSGKILIACLGGMESLEQLRLSHNKLSKRIPSSLVRLTFLSFLDVSYNKLSGVVPSGGQFSTFPEWSIEGNDGLCGLHLKPFSQTDHKPRARSPDEDFALSKATAIVRRAVGFMVTVGYCFAAGWVTRTQRRRANSGCNGAIKTQLIIG